MHPFSRVPLKPSRAASRESAREAGGRTQSPGGRAVQPPPAEHLLCAGHWDTHPFNAGRASLLHITYPPLKASARIQTQTPQSLFPPTWALSRSPTAWAASFSAESMSNEHTAAHLTEHGVVPSQPSRTSVLLSAPRGLLPLTGGRPGSEGGCWALLCSHSFCLHNCLLLGTRVERLPPSRCVCPGSRDGTCAHIPPGTTSVQVGWLQPPACLFCTCRCLNH